MLYIWIKEGDYMKKKLAFNLPHILYRVTNQVLMQYLCSFSCILAGLFCFLFVGENQLYNAVLILFVGENQAFDHHLNLEKKGEYLKK